MATSTGRLTYFGSTGTDSFVPEGPTRIVDTRVALGAPKGPVRPGGTLVIAPTTESGCVPTCPSDTADVLNVTVTQAKASGFLTVYPAGQARPGSSNLNFSAGETAANLVTVRDINGEISIYNGSGGSVQVVVDEDGYYIRAP